MRQSEDREKARWLLFRCKNSQRRFGHVLTFSCGFPLRPSWIFGDEEIATTGAD
jgi:hypothetical protein